MGRNPPEPDLSRCLAVLGADRTTVERWERALGVPWAEVPPLRQLVVMVAARVLARDMPELSEADALSEACEALGIHDDPYRATRPSDSLLRTLRRWRAGQSVRADDSEAA